MEQKATIDLSDPSIKKVNEDWNNFAPVYAINHETSTFSVGVTIAEVASARSAKSAIVEIACGGGSLTSYLVKVKPTGVPLYAYDISQEMVHFAISRLDYLTSENAKNMSDPECTEYMLANYKGQKDEKTFESIKTTVQVANAERLPLDNESADVVVGNFVLHVTPNAEKVLEEAYRITKKGGKIAFSVWGKEEEAFMVKAFKEVTMALKGPQQPAKKGDNDPVPINGFVLGAGDNLKNVVEKVGFKNLRVWESFMPSNNQTEEEIIRLLVGRPSGTAALGAKPREEVEEIARGVARKQIEESAKCGKPFGFGVKIVFAFKE